jgi:hypothetical protein
VQWENSNRGPHLIVPSGSGIGDAHRVNQFQLREKCRKFYRSYQPVPGNDARRDELGWGCSPVRADGHYGLIKEFIMRNNVLAIAAIVGAMSAPLAAQAQSGITTGVVRGGSVVVEDVDGIAVDQRPAFQEYIIRERVPNYTIPDRVVIGGVLPETGVTYYDVPQTFGVTPYRYTVVNGQTVLIEPRSRRIVQVVE